MDIDNAAQFLVSSILIGLGISALAVALVFINNLLSRYWKPVKIWVPSYFDNTPSRFMTDEEIRVAQEQKQASINKPY
jgi:cell division protein FtsX